jgi:hypothetical protein
VSERCDEPPEGLGLWVSPDPLSSSERFPELLWYEAVEGTGWSTEWARLYYEAAWYLFELTAVGRLAADVSSS